VTFVTPLALLGLLGIPLLVLLERWRRKPRPRTWPSLLLWQEVEGITDRQARRVDPRLLFECAAIFLLALAAAEPGIVTRESKTRVVVLVDEGPHMQALRSAGRTALEATFSEIRRMRPNRLIPVRGDIEVLASRDGPWNVVATSRPGLESTERYTVVGRAPQGVNLGIDALEVRGRKLWFAIATDGEPRQVRVLVGAKGHDVMTGVGTWAEYDDEIEILEKDNYDGDNQISLRRLLVGVRDETKSRFVAAALRAGTPSQPGNDLVITTRGGSPRRGQVRGTDCVASAGIFDGLLLDDCVWEDPKTREGDGLLSFRGEAVAAWLELGRTLWLGMPLDRDWDEHGTLAVMIERAKREMAEAALLPGEALVGDAIARPAPGHVWTKGIDRAWDGTLPEHSQVAEETVGLRLMLGLLAALVLMLYLLQLSAVPRR